VVAAPRRGRALRRKGDNSYLVLAKVIAGSLQVHLRACFPTANLWEMADRSPLELPFTAIAYPPSFAGEGRERGASAFTAGQVKRQVRPGGA
jgi:hypothetical protein